MNLKKIIARNIIRQYHDEVSAEMAEQFFVTQFQGKVFDQKAFEPVQLSSLKFGSDSVPLVELCHHVKKDETKTAVRRLIISGAVHINNHKWTDPNQLVELNTGTKIKIGKRFFVELV